MTLSAVSIRRALAALALCAWPASAGAHEYWLCPSRYTAAPGESVSVSAYVGTGFRGELKPWAAPRALRFDVREAGVRDLKPAAVNGADAFGGARCRDGGGLSFAYQGDFAFIELPGPEFDAYLALEGLDGPRRARADAGRSNEPGRERYARCCRTWVAGLDAGRITAAAGLTIEIVPERDPAAGGAVPFRVWLRGQPYANALVRAWHRPLREGAAPFPASTRDSVGFGFAARTDASGRVVVPVKAAGEWMLSCVHMEPSTAPREADWQSWWASLTFAHPGPSAAVRRHAR